MVSDRLGRERGGSEALPHHPRQARARAIALALLAVLLGADLVLISLHVLWGYDDLAWSMENEASHVERVQHLKWAVAALLMLALSIRRRAVIYAAWALLFAYFAADDSMRLHEQGGRWLIGVLDLRSFEDFYLEHFSYFYLRAQNFGELIVAASLGSIVALALWIVWPAADAVAERRLAKKLVAWLLLFALFAVGFDMLHTMAWEIYPPAVELIGVIEDGGELICASILVGGLALELARAGRVPITCLRRTQA